jgi:hypothetical protein
MPNLSPDVENEFKQVGQRLALLLASANLPDEVKDAWAALIPEMSLEQIDRLAKALEGYLSADEQTELFALAEKAKQAQTVFEQQKKQAEEQALKELDEIESMLSEK